MQAQTISIRDMERVIDVFGRLELTVKIMDGCAYAIKACSYGEAIDRDLIRVSHKTSASGHQTETDMEIPYIGYIERIDGAITRSAHAYAHIVVVCIDGKIDSIIKSWSERSEYTATEKITHK